MKKLLMLFVLCGLISGQAWGKVFWMNDKQYCCYQNCSSGFSIKGNYQLLGKTTAGEDYEANANIYCRSSGGIDVKSPNWCNSSIFKSNDIPGAEYCLRADPDTEDRQYCLLQEELETGMKGYAVHGACLYAGCRRDYIKVGDSKCLSKDDVAVCKESDITFATSVDSTKWKRTGTGGNFGVYCFTESELKTLSLESDNQKNICLANKHKIRNVSNPETYFSCNSRGVWEEQKYPECGEPGECKKGDPDCVAVPFDNSTKQQIISAAGTGQDWVLDTGSTVCIKWMCNPVTHVKSGNGCITKARHQANVDAVNQQNRIAAENRKACEGSGGTWASSKCTCSAPHVSLSGNSCVCNSGYEWNTDKKQGCKLTDKKALEEACNAAPAGTATWNDAAGACVCTNTDQTFDVQRKACVDNQDFAACKPLVDRGVATWNSGAKQCVCNQPGYIVQNNNCIESPEAAAERERREKEAAERAKAEALRKSRRNISDAHGILVGMREMFKTSVWKDEEGKFNTARLVSDSVAGVVLGTVGGVVTSNVVKKNQVENGFEDIKCAVGGQTVADWGDEFRVGIQ